MSKGFSHKFVVFTELSWLTLKIVSGAVFTELSRLAKDLLKVMELKLNVLCNVCSRLMA